MFLNIITKQKSSLVIRVYQKCLLNIHSVKLNIFSYLKIDNSKHLNERFIHNYILSDKNVFQPIANIAIPNDPVLVKNTNEPLTSNEPETPTFKFKSILYNENEDEIIAELNDCKDATQVCIVERN